MMGADDAVRRLQARPLVADAWMPLGLGFSHVTTAASSQHACPRLRPLPCPAPPAAGAAAAARCGLAARCTTTRSWPLSTLDMRSRACQAWPARQPSPPVRCTPCRQADETEGAVAGVPLLPAACTHKYIRCPAVCMDSWGSWARCPAPEACPCPSPSCLLTYTPAPQPPCSWTHATPAASRSTWAAAGRGC